VTRQDEGMEEQQERTYPASDFGGETDTDDERHMTQEQEKMSANRSDGESVERERTADTDGPTGQAEVALFEDSDQEAFWERWSAIQTSFVDEPRHSVEEANALVTDLMDRLVSSFREEQSRLKEQWTRGEEVTTEDLRTTLQRYRSFFGRVLKL
jgi:hypothetical protein